MEERGRKRTTAGENDLRTRKKETPAANKNCVMSLGLLRCGGEGC
jgi:hypothetical protein